MLCWYRVKNSQIINSICFFSKWPNLPLMMEIGYGVHPLFAPPLYRTDVYFPNRPIFDVVRFLDQSIVENYPMNEMGYIRYAVDAQVYAPGRDGRGIYTFDEIILPQFHRIQTIADCYAFHKQQYIKHSSALSCISQIYIDEAIYLNDVAKRSYYERDVLKGINTYKQLCIDSPNRKEYRDILQHFEQQKAAIFDGGRNEYIKILEQRQFDMIKVMKKKFGIVI